MEQPEEDLTSGRTKAVEVAQTILIYHKDKQAETQRGATETPARTNAILRVASVEPDDSRHSLVRPSHHRRRSTIATAYHINCR